MKIIYYLFIALNNVQAFNQLSGAQPERKHFERKTKPMIERLSRYEVIVAANELVIVARFSLSLSLSLSFSLAI